MALNSYFDFAENDFQYFKASYDAVLVSHRKSTMNIVDTVFEMKDGKIS